MTLAVELIGLAAILSVQVLIWREQTRILRAVEDYKARYVLQQTLRAAVERMVRARTRGLRWGSAEPSGRGRGDGAQSADGLRTE